ncbi:hypothetical protein CAPTEDRAFT_197202 [Capitella teleta]|uniref:Apple domain-containing protein n=1 Tax=Capitella teleta TaxID=283909 RepID=R7UL39_CAPTE|nr:hypothetical protein CAPTEDRAFT_197202 [Capitella teleta]|eukprot:ELU03947.1 hypothetical protein CAPTEDRAFT_197202 [Capitella teleta]
MEIHRLVWLISYLMIFKDSFGAYIELFFNTQGLTSLPYNIDPNVNALFVKDNNISSIRKSDFNDMYPVLSYLHMGMNIITSVEDGCFMGTILKAIYLPSNLLTAIPDLREVKDILETFSAKANKITRISREEIEYLTKISTLVLSNNPLVQVLELTPLPPSLATLNLRNSDLECCNGTVWMKSVASSVNLRLSAQPCSYPSEWSAIPWASITEDMLQAQRCNYTVASTTSANQDSSQYRGAYFVQNHNDIETIVSSEFIVVHPFVSIITCAHSCISQENCISVHADSEFCYLHNHSQAADVVYDFEQLWP